MNIQLNISLIQFNYIREINLFYQLMARECRPLDLLDFKILLPELVFILARNPDVRALFNFVPRNVLFVILIIKI